MDLGNGIEIKFNSFTPDQLQTAASEIIEAANEQGLELSQFAGANVLGATIEDDTAASPAEPESTDKLEVSVFDTLTPEKQERARKEITALAETFNRPPSDFQAISYMSEAGKQVTRVALTATEGYDLGNPEKIFDPKRNWDETLAQQKDGKFVFEVDGEQIDSLEGIDSQYLKAVAAANPEIYEWVWRTGEKDKANRHDAPIANLGGGQVYLYRSDRSHGNGNLRVRPAGGDLS